MKRLISEKSRRHLRRRGTTFSFPLLERLDTREQVGSLLTHSFGVSPFLGFGDEPAAGESHQAFPFAAIGAESTELPPRLAAPTGGFDHLLVAGPRKLAG